MNCLECEHFAWWDGDYVCLHNMSVLMNSPNGDFDGLAPILKRHKNCSNFSKRSLCLYKDAYEKYLRDKYGKC